MNAINSRHDGDAIRAWLGPAADVLTDEQADRFCRAWDDIGARYGAYNQGESAAALAAALQYLLGETDPDTIGLAVTTARAQWDETVAAAAQVARMAADDGVGEVELARRIGVDRARTVRRWLGKA